MLAGNAVRVQSRGSWNQGGVVLPGLRERYDLRVPEGGAGRIKDRGGIDLDEVAVNLVGGGVRRIPPGTRECSARHARHGRDDDGRRMAHGPHGHEHADAPGPRRRGTGRRAVHARYGHGHDDVPRSEAVGSRDHVGSRHARHRRVDGQTRNRRSRNGDVRLQRSVSRSAHPGAEGRDDRGARDQRHPDAHDDPLAWRAPRQPLRRSPRGNPGRHRARRQLHLRGPRARCGHVLVPPACAGGRSAGPGSLRKPARHLPRSRVLRAGAPGGGFRPGRHAHGRSGSPAVG